MIRGLQRVSKPWWRLLLCHFVCKTFKHLNDKGTAKGYQALSSPEQKPRNARALKTVKQESGVRRDFRDMLRAGDGIRTHDHLLGKQALYR